MKLIILLSTLYAIAHFGNCQFNLRIVNGYEAKPSQFSYMVSILYNRQHSCGGSIISENYVITAAHCLIYNDTGVPVQLISILAGQSRINHNKSDQITCGVKQYFYPTDWRNNDIAVLKLNRSLSYKNLNISFIPLSVKAVPAGTTCTISGWGHQSYNVSELSRNLLAANISIADHSQCSMKYNGINITLPKYIICAGDHNGDSCQGDSGGPLVCNGFLTGIVSTGIECAHEYYPGLYTNVSHNIQWIKLVTNRTYLIPNNITNTSTTLVFPTTITIYNNVTHNHVSTISTTIVFPTNFNINNNYLNSASNPINTYVICICILNLYSSIFI